MRKPISISLFFLVLFFLGCGNNEGKAREEVVNAMLSDVNIFEVERVLIDEFDDFLNHKNLNYGEVNGFQNLQFYALMREFEDWLLRLAFDENGGLKKMKTLRDEILRDYVKNNYQKWNSHLDDYNIFSANSFWSDFNYYEYEDAIPRENPTFLVAPWRMVYECPEICGYQEWAYDMDLRNSWVENIAGGDLDLFSRNLDLIRINIIHEVLTGFQKFAHLYIFEDISFGTGGGPFDSKSISINGRLPINEYLNVSFETILNALEFAQERPLNSRKWSRYISLYDYSSNEAHDVSKLYEILSIFD